MNAELLGGLMRSGVAISVATIVVLLLRKPLQRWLGARVAYALWLLVPFAMLAVLIPAPTRQTLLPVVSQGWIGAPGALANAMTPADGTDGASILLALWMLGALTLAVFFACRQLAFNRRIVRRQGQSFDEVEGHGPAVTGLLRPRIVLPSDFSQRYNDDEQALVLAHERVHLRRGDVQAQGIATALRCVFWFNPLLHFAATRFRFDQELACDAVVLAQFPCSRRSYGDAMLKTQLAESGFPIGCHWQSIHPLKERIAMLKQPIPTTFRRASGATLVAALVLAGSISAWAAQPAAGGHRATTAAHVTEVAPVGAMAPPAYPAEALAKHLGGKVELIVHVGADGAVKDIRVESAKPSGVFDKVAVDAARKWKFHPKTLNGKAVDGLVRVPVEFSPDSGKKSG